MSTEENRAIVRGIIETWNKGTLDVLDDLCMADCVCHRPPYPDIEGLDGYKRWIADFRNAFPDCQITIDGIIVEGDRASIQATYRGTHTGRPLMNGDIPSTGKQVVGPGCIVFRLVDGKVVEEWEYWDELGFWQQLGCKLVLPWGVR